MPAQIPLKSKLKVVSPIYCQSDFANPREEKPVHLLLEDALRVLEKSPDNLPDFSLESKINPFGSRPQDASTSASSASHLK
eukprot:m.86033 g.86033  ORF g.86033 m.86033 type:complete len:81 (+) comp36486_c1_seq4:1096-1338(+)